MNFIRQRGQRMLNLQQFNNENHPINIGGWHPPVESLPNQQYILRMLIKKLHGDFHIPSELDWARDFINHCFCYQNNTIGIIHPYCYVTVRSGLVTSTTDDEWHLDGFSTKISHLPEQNYLWTNSYPTEFIAKAITFPEDFSGSKHNINLFIQDTLALHPTYVHPATANCIYCFDPYVIHRRPSVPMNIHRTFIRVSFIPIEIIDDTCTRNPLLPTPVYGRNAVTDYRNKLERYKVT